MTQSPIIENSRRVWFPKVAQKASPLAMPIYVGVFIFEKQLRIVSDVSMALSALFAWEYWRLNT